jgi:hypothetical protein|tara:strand:- start:498 stop:815 length:318 start_codon:yes stop_codon:yes gene_type:complete
MASGLKGTSKPSGNTDTTLYTVSGSACVVNISACNNHASNTDDVEIFIVPTGQSKGMQHAIEVDTTLAGKAVIERTGIVMGIGDFIVVNSQNGTTSFNVWGVDLA